MTFRSTTSSKRSWNSCRERGPPATRTELHIPAGHERGEQLSATQRVAYTVVRNALAGVFKLYFRVEVVGRENFPKHGGVVVSASHRSNLDTPIICVITQRRLRYMGKESLWKSTFGGWFLTRSAASR